jgi:hypothetical protein
MADLVLAATRRMGEYLATVGVLIVVVVAAALVLLKYRGRLLARDSDAALHEGLFENLRRMRNQGRLTQEEYDAARRKMVAKAAGKAPPAPPATGAAIRPVAPGEVRARPGYDLTGAPLPPPSQADE